MGVDAGKKNILPCIHLIVFHKAKSIGAGGKRAREENVHEGLRFVVRTESTQTTRRVLPGAQPGYRGMRELRAQADLLQLHGHEHVLRLFRLSVLLFWNRILCNSCAPPAMELLIPADMAS